MSEEINEPILVTAKFEKGQLTPLLFFWRGRDYRVSRVDFVYASCRGEAKFYFFSVSGDGTRYQLVFNNRTFDWKLGKVETEE